ncbi:MAG: AMP-binding protein [Chloroflexi bacterium]|jgi:non-ribosomal peptide synthetase component E (peptide arylation enzyme)|nr:AMP-binding protein [Chloroflexota bacterium]MBT7082225.1 AMP-binding protein [Chloroflexota bacterium]MBT7290415.1 AMP-binding protein [Chloroflexota bacterium]
MIPIRYTEREFEQLCAEGKWGTPVDYVEQNANKYPDKTALIDSGGRLTFLDVKQKSDRLAIRLLEMGLKRDDRIVVQLPNVVEWVIVHTALQKAGLIGLYVMQYFRHKEIEYSCKEIEAVGYLGVADFRGFNYFDMIRELRPKLPDLKHVFVVGDNVPDGAVSVNEMRDSPLGKEHPADFIAKSRVGWGQIYQLRVTSGTTGMPKLVECALTYPSLEDTLKQRYKVTPDDVFGAFAPLSGGPSGVHCRGFGISQRMGCTVAMLEKFDAADAVDLIQRERISFGTGVPTMLAMISALPNLSDYDLSSLRVFEVAGASLPYSVAKEFEEKVGCKVINRLGGVDIGFGATSSVDDPPEVRWGSVGKPIPEITLKLLDEQGNDVPQGEVGEIAYAKTRGSDRSYYRDLEMTLEREAQGLARTGDLGKFDEHGNLYVVGRRKDVIIRGGQNIFPAEIESMLITHPAVFNVAVVSMPDRVMGEKACAYVICKQGQILTFDEMTSHLVKKKVAKYKLPERLQVVDSFPYSGDGQKVMKRTLSEDVTAKLKAEGVVF